MGPRGYVLAVLLVIAMITLRGCSFGVHFTFVSVPKKQASERIAPSPTACNPVPRDKGSRMDRSLANPKYRTTAHPGLPGALLRSA